jgi:hypothetical protein
MRSPSVTENDMFSTRDVDSGHCNARSHVESLNTPVYGQVG